MFQGTYREYKTLSIIVNAAQPLLTSGNLISRPLCFFAMLCMSRSRGPLKDLTPGVGQSDVGRSRSAPSPRPPDLILIAKSLVRLVLHGASGTPLHFERRKAVESSFRGFPPPSHTCSFRSETFGNPYKPSLRKRSLRDQ